MTPPRILNTTRNDFERALLRSASSDRAPEAVRRRALESVARALASAGEPAALPTDAGSFGEPGAASGAAGGRRDPLRWALPGMYLGVVALAASIALVLWQRTSSERLARAHARGSVALSGVERAAQADVRSPGEAAPTAPAALDNTGAQRALANTSAVTPSFRADEAALQTLTEDEAPDWLGAQLQLLREARRQLELGELDQARSLLDSYERRFPGGVVGPQISALRDELTRRQSTSATSR